MEAQAHYITCYGIYVIINMYMNISMICVYMYRTLCRHVMISVTYEHHKVYAIYSVKCIIYSIKYEHIIWSKSKRRRAWRRFARPLAAGLQEKGRGPSLHLDARGTY